MNKPLKLSYVSLLVIVVCLQTISNSMAQPFQRPKIKSPEIDGSKVTLRVHAPQAEKVMLSSSDIPGIWQGLNMKKSDDGSWEVEIESLEPGSYRYNFNVDGVAVLDPVNISMSESNEVLWSMLHVLGASFMDTQKVPHGAISEVYYYSESLKRTRRMHVYTPPGYESGKDEYPVFYLLHGAFDSDDSWTTVGRAGFILDNLIASGKAKPMVVVMPKGHTESFNFGQQLPDTDPFLVDFTSDIAPYIESNYRILSGRKNHAIAGLSMGGWHTLNLFASNMEDFAYVGVYSSGIFDLMGNRSADNSGGKSWVEKNESVLSNAEKKKGLQLFWFATGSEDFLLETTNKTVDILREHNFKIFYKKTGGGHTWDNWREYLNEFAPLLFKPVPEDKADNS